ncbi:MAG TPA: ribosome maturation factor RimM [Candidatus Stackebrandtia excrementipullorum]|nr:ribosome maturation factor RimM [Candidatus Stackebrandtia excrementipullorum]
MHLVVGRIIRPHGIRGDLICEVRTDEPAERFTVGSVFTTDPTEHGPVELTSVRPYQGRLLITLDEVDDRNDADALRGVQLCVDSGDLPAPDDPDEFRDHDLVGLSVESVAGDVIGTVAKIEHGPAHDMLIVNREGAKPALIPFIHVMVPTVDLAGRRIVVDLPDGLLDL